MALLVDDDLSRGPASIWIKKIAHDVDGVVGADGGALEREEDFVRA